MTTNKPMPCARALHGFEGQATHELSFSAGVSILLLRRIDENWLEGKLDGKVGIFPANYVKFQTGSPSVARESALAKSGKPYGIAIYSFRGGQQGDLPLVKGELIELTGTVGSDWLRGKVGEKTGIFPASFAQIIKPLQTESVNINGHVDLTSNGSSPTPEEDEQERVGTLSSSSPPSNEGNGLGDDEVYELEFGETTNLSDSRPKPVAKPRRRLDRSRHVSAPGLEAVQNGVVYQHKESVAKETESHDQHPTPTRSAPAPPNATESHSSDRQFMTLPKPKPRHKLSRHASESDQIRSLESELTIEEKMLESAQNLLLISKDEVKIAKLQEAVKVHQTNIERLQQQLEDAKSKEREKEKIPLAAPTTV